MSGRALSGRQAMAEVRRLWDVGRVRWTHHAEERLVQRGLDVADVAYCLRYGHVTGTSHPGRAWRYEVTGTTVERRRMRCVVEIVGDLVMVTVIV
jgi:hypothetical protein